MEISKAQGLDLLLILKCSGISGEYFIQTLFYFYNFMLSSCFVKSSIEFKAVRDHKSKFMMMSQMFHFFLQFINNNNKEESHCDIIKRKKPFGKTSVGETTTTDPEK
ncbi:CLUMA_CG019690, isoform A [Clunio marinus]|uniref:CLUMA_CG019690, isoform A n=1 Tax=Clunio marinus TaxID=568069 RepID=A0A1J1J388_9DIPT|nr:CLUMA_CG019690, isoform A [Clunio marinus]